MKVLITSGGTKVTIDPVRHITNLSRGRFGAQIASAALEDGAEVTYLGATHAEAPFRIMMDLEAGDHDATMRRMKDQIAFYEKVRHRYRYVSFTEFSEYHEQLKNLIHHERPDVVVLAAAVSDYLVQNPAKEKLRTQDSLEIRLSEAPKIINSIKKWHPDAVLVAFKLLVEADDVTLVEEARRGMEKHGANFVVANTLASIRRGAHEVLLVEPSGAYKKHTKNLAQAVMERIKLECQSQRKQL